MLLPHSNKHYAITRETHVTPQKQQITLNKSAQDTPDACHGRSARLWSHVIGEITSSGLHYSLTALGVGAAGLHHHTQRYRQRGDARCIQDALRCVGWWNRCVKIKYTQGVGAAGLHHDTQRYRQRGDARCIQDALRCMGWWNRCVKIKYTQGTGSRVACCW